MRFAVSTWLVTRLAIAALVATSVYLWPAVYLAHGTGAAPLGFVDGLCAWDCPIYAALAQHGYTRPVDLNFWPLLPLLARPLVWLRVPPMVAVLVVANLAALGAFVAVHAVFAEVADAATARTALVLWAAYPFSFFFAAGYTEPLMVLAGAGALWLALRGRHGWAGAALGAGVLARAVTAAAGLGLVVAQLEAAGGRVGAMVRRRAVLALALPLLPLAAWLAFQQRDFADALLFVHARRAWGWHNGLGVPAAMARWRESRMLLVYPFVAIAPAVGSFALLARRRWWPLAAIAIPLTLVFWSIGAFGLGRYSASTWPAFLPLGAWLARRPTLHPAVLVALALLQGLFLHLYAHGYELQ